MTVSVCLVSRTWCYLLWVVSLQISIESGWLLGITFSEHSKIAAWEHAACPECEVLQAQTYFVSSLKSSPAGTPSWLHLSARPLLPSNGSKTQMYFPVSANSCALLYTIKAGSSHFVFDLGTIFWLFLTIMVLWPNLCYMRYSKFT